MNEKNPEKEPVMTVEVPVYELPCEVRIYVDEAGKCSIRRIYG